MLNQSFSADDILGMIQEEIGLILEEAGLPVRRVSPEDRLSVDLSLKSMALARIVTALEIRTGADPFQELVPITSIRTVGDLQEAYRRFFAGEEGQTDPDELVESQRRAALRKSIKGAGR